MAELAEFERGICECGFHVSLSADRRNLFTPVVRYCPLCAQLAVRGRVEDDRDHRATPENASPSAPRPSDGRHESVHFSGRADD